MTAPWLPALLLLLQLQSHLTKVYLAKTGDGKTYSVSKKSIERGAPSMKNRALADPDLADLDLQISESEEIDSIPDMDSIDSGDSEDSPHFVSTMELSEHAAAAVSKKSLNRFASFMNNRALTAPDDDLDLQIIEENARLLHYFNSFLSFTNTIFTSNFVIKAEKLNQQMWPDVWAANWNYSTNITDDNKKKHQKLKEELGKMELELGLEAQKFDIKHIKDHDIKRKLIFLRILGCSALSETKRKKYNEITTTMKEIHR